MGWQEKQALEFEKIYNQHHNNPKFEEKLLTFLRSKSYKEIGIYYWISTYLSRPSYTELTDLELSKLILDDGLKEINKRLENEDRTDEEDLYLDMTKCELLWRYGILNFSLQKDEEACKYFDEANSRKEQPSCIDAFPAMTREERESIYKRYAACKK